MIHVFYKNYSYSKVQNPSINKIQVELGWLLMLCHVASLFTFPLLPNLTSKMLYSVLTCQYVSMSALKSELCHKFHKISIISVIAVINVRGIQPSVHETPIWLFLSHVSYNSPKIRPMKYMEKYINLIIHPKTLGFPQIQDYKRRMTTQEIQLEWAP